MKKYSIVLALFFAINANAELSKDYQNELIDVYLGKTSAQSIDEKYCEKGLIEACISKANSLKELEVFEKQYQNSCQNNDEKNCKYEILTLRNKLGIFTKNALKEKDLKMLEKATEIYDTLSKLTMNISLKSNIYKAYYVLSSTKSSLNIKEENPKRLKYAIDSAKESIKFYEKQEDDKTKFLKLINAYNFLSTLGTQNFDKIFVNNEYFNELKANHNEYFKQEKFYLNKFLGLNKDKK